MYHTKTRFLLVFGVFCLCAADVVAAPSVRVLGSNNSGIKAVPVKTEVTNANVGAPVKKASVKTGGVASQQQVSGATVGRIGAANNASGAGRIPVMPLGTSLNTGYKPVTKVSTSNINNAGVDTNDISDKVDDLESQLDDKVNITDLNNYYTKTEIDEINSNYYTSSEIDNMFLNLDNKVTNIDNKVTNIDNSILTINGDITEINNRINNINTASSVQYIQELQNNIAQYEIHLNEIDESITNVLSRTKKIFDAKTETYKYVKLVDDFDPSIFADLED